MQALSFGPPVKIGPPSATGRLLMQALSFGPQVRIGPPSATGRLFMQALSFGPHVMIGPPSATGRLLMQALSFGPHVRIGPPSAAGTGLPLLAMKLPTSPTVRIAILTASFVLVFMVLLLLHLGFVTLLVRRKCLCQSIPHAKLEA